jgi:hypothetical protein
MMQSTFQLLFALSFVLLVGGIYLSESRRVPAWPAPPATLASGFLFMLVALQSAKIEVATSNGIQTTSEPVFGIIAGMMGVAGFVLAFAMAIQWFPSARGKYGTR